jgi:5'-nucleotidase / UDP-sugar diphosphatase
MRWRSIRALAVALFCLLQSPARADLIPPSRASAPLTLLQINDVYTIRTVDGSTPGGLARVAALKKQLSAPGKAVLLVVAGDFLSPSVESSIFKGKQMVDTLNAVGVDIATLGNHEFDFGPDVLRERMKEARWQWVVSNVLDEATGKPIGGAARYLIRRYGPLTVGFLGLCLTGDEISPTNLRGLKMLDPVRTAARYVPELKRQGATVIVAITHLNYPDDRRLATRLPEIDLVLGGHEHVPITATVNRTLISKAGTNAQFVARVDLDRAQPGSPLERFFELIPMTSALPQDPATARVVAEYESELSTQLDQVVGATTVPLNAVTESIRAGESNLGDLLADVMRGEAQADVAILNAGTVRSDRVYPAGQLTRRDLLAMLPFGDVICKVAVSGATLLSALNNGVSELGDDAGRFPQVSGLSFTIDPGAPPSRRVRDVQVNGQSLDPQRQYTVAITDYVLKGGDGYTMFGSAKVLVSPESGPLLLTVLEAYIRQNGQIAPQVESRIRILPAASTTPTPAKPVAPRMGDARLPSRREIPRRTEEATHA